MKGTLLALAVALCLTFLSQVLGKNCTGNCLKADVNARMPFVMRLKIQEHERCAKTNTCTARSPARQNAPCQNGKADEYECKNVDLLAYVPLSELGSNSFGSDIWGWTDPKTGREYAIVCCADGTSFVDITEPTDPQVLGFLPTHTYTSFWRDVKVYSNHAFIGCEAYNHGMQVYDLTQLRDLKPQENGVKLLQSSAHYDEFTSSHNIVINEDRGFAYAVGSQTCNSGLHIINIRDPLNPQFEGCYACDGYVHDAQCVVYNGSDNRYQGREICFCYNEDTLTIVDVEDKNDIKMVSRVPYQDSQYTHQGWLNEEHTYLLLNDELDEYFGPQPRSRTLVWNIERLDNPIHVYSFYSSKKAIDHNLYIKGHLAYETNYCAGLRILNIDGITDRYLEEVGYFDVAPECDSPVFRGSWSNYPYFKSGTIVVSSIERGLFVLKYTGS